MSATFPPRTPAMTDAGLRTTRDGDVCTVTIHRPDKLNALSRPVLGALGEAFAGAAADPTLKCMVIRGAGDRYFAAGGDLVDLADVRSESETIGMVEQCRTALDAVRDCPVPVIALLNGDAIGGGAELAVACDFRLICDHAHLGFIHGRMAITSAWGGGTDLIDLCGASRALRMMVRAELVTAQTAWQWGLADVVVTTATADAALARFVEPMLGQSALALRACKAQVIAFRHGLSREERRAVESRSLVGTWRSEDHWSAVERFLAGERRN